jgi:ATP-dependent Clp protease protease subunit
VDGRRGSDLPRRAAPHAKAAAACCCTLLARLRSAAAAAPPPPLITPPSAADRLSLTALHAHPPPTTHQRSNRTQDLGGDPFGLLLRQRIVFLGGEVNDFAADAIVSQLLLLDAQDPTKDIKLFINSPGGSVTAGMGIYDAMMMCRADVQTYCFGLAASMGAFLLGAGAKGKRHSMANSRIMIHQPLGGASGAAVDIEIQVGVGGVVGWFVWFVVCVVCVGAVSRARRCWLSV